MYYTHWYKFVHATFEQKNPTFSSNWYYGYVMEILIFDIDYHLINIEIKLYWVIHTNADDQSMYCLRQYQNTHLILHQRHSIIMLINVFTTHQVFAVHTVPDFSLQRIECDIIEYYVITATWTKKEEQSGDPWFALRLGWSWGKLRFLYSISWVFIYCI